MQRINLSGQTTGEEPDHDTDEQGGRRVGRYLLVGGAALATAAFLRRRQRARRIEREMTTIEITDEPVAMDG